MTEKMEPREGYAQALLELGAEHEDLVVLDGDCAKANYTNRFGAQYPDRFFNLGIAECDIVGTAAGLSLGGKIPFAKSEMPRIRRGDRCFDFHACPSPFSLWLSWLPGGRTFPYLLNRQPIYQIAITSRYWQAD